MARMPKLPRGMGPEVILTLIDLGLRPYAVASAMGTSKQYVYLVLKQNGRLKGSREDIIRKRPNIIPEAEPYIKRMFFEWESMFFHMAGVAHATLREAQPAPKVTSRRSVKKAA
jgi:hypothetical protein